MTSPYLTEPAWREIPCRCGHPADYHRDTYHGDPCDHFLCDCGSYDPETEGGAMYRWSGVDRRSEHHSGATTQQPVRFVEDKFKAGWRGLLVHDGDRQVGRIVPAVVNGGRRSWWAES